MRKVYYFSTYLSEFWCQKAGPFAHRAYSRGIKSNKLSKLHVLMKQKSTDRFFEIPNNDGHSHKETFIKFLKGF